MALQRLHAQSLAGITDMLPEDGLETEVHALLFVLVPLALETRREAYTKRG